MPWGRAWLYRQTQAEARRATAAHLPLLAVENRAAFADVLPVCPPEQRGHARSCTELHDIENLVYCTMGAFSRWSHHPVVVYDLTIAQNESIALR